MTSKQVASSHTNNIERQTTLRTEKFISYNGGILEINQQPSEIRQMNMMMIMTHDDTVIMKLVVVAFFFKLLFPRWINEDDEEKNDAPLAASEAFFSLFAIKLIRSACMLMKMCENVKKKN